MDKQLREELDEMREELEGLRQIGTEFHLLCDALDKVVSTVIQANPDQAPRFVVSLERAMSEWQLMRRPRHSEAFRLLQKWHGDADSLERLDNPDAAAQRARRRFGLVEADRSDQPSTPTGPAQAPSAQEAPREPADAPNPQNDEPDKPTD